MLIFNATIVAKKINMRKQYSTFFHQALAAGRKNAPIRNAGGGIRLYVGGDNPCTGHRNRYVHTYGQPDWRGD